MHVSAKVYDGPGILIEEQSPFHVRQIFRYGFLYRELRDLHHVFEDSGNDEPAQFSAWDPGSGQSLIECFFSGIGRIKSCGCRGIPEDFLTLHQYGFRSDMTCIDSGKNFFFIQVAPPALVFLRKLPAVYGTD